MLIGTYLAFLFIQLITKILYKLQKYINLIKISTKKYANYEFKNCKMKIESKKAKKYKKY